MTFTRLVTANHLGYFRIRDLPAGDYRLSMENHKLAYAGRLGRIRVPPSGCTYSAISFSYYGPAERLEDALITARNYVTAAIDLVTGWLR